MPRALPEIAPGTVHWIQAIPCLYSVSGEINILVIFFTPSDIPTAVMIKESPLKRGLFRIPRDAWFKWKMNGPFDRLVKHWIARFKHCGINRYG
jgi:hypothetical protein